LVDEERGDKATGRQGEGRFKGLRRYSKNPCGREAAGIFRGKGRGGRGWGLVRSDYIMRHGVLLTIGLNLRQRTEMGIKNSGAMVCRVAVKGLR
jgi:hypothetical protein